MNNTTISTFTSHIIIDLNENYDTIGATIFIIFVLCWYSVSAAFLLGIQTMAHREFFSDSNEYFKKTFVPNSHRTISNKRILEELVDTKTREKLWSIYLGTSTGLNERMTQADLLRVRHMQRQLAIITKHNHEKDHRNKRCHSISVNNLIDPNIESSTCDMISMDYRLRVRRRSETNQEILEQWQAAVKNLNMKETVPWTIQKVLIKRQLRRQCHHVDYQPV